MKLDDNETVRSQISGDAEFIGFGDFHARKRFQHLGIAADEIVELPVQHRGNHRRLRLAHAGKKDSTVVDGGKAFHFGFDPARGELKKKGHLFSLIVTPESWKILKHVDKNRREEDPNETLAEQKSKFDRDTWYTLSVTTWGKYVTARVDGKETLKASHATFGVKKPTLVFRCLGNGVEIDDIRVWTQRAK